VWIATFYVGINNLARKKAKSFAHINVTSSYSFSFYFKKKRKNKNNAMLKTEWKEQGFIDEPVAEGTDLKAEIRRLCKEKDAIILAHYYTIGDIQDIADFVGDSLALARKAAETDAKMMVMCGVHFMAETCKLLSPEKTVLCPDLNAGCSLADSCKAEDLKKFKDEHPGYQVISYVNTTAAVKALTDVVVTSGNAKKVVDQLPKDAKLIFGPDYNLGNYINEVTGRQMLLWNGGCHVHERFSVTKILELKKQYPKAVVMAHLECKGPVLAVADVKGSTADMLKYARENRTSQFIVATEAGILHELQRNCPDSQFIPVPPEISESGLECSCNECQYMKMNTLLKVYNTLKYEWPQIEVDPEIAKEAVKPIERMLELS
jgi:quinolinate synthase